MYIAIEDTIIHHLPVIKPQGLAVYTVIKNHINQKTKKAFPSIERVAALCDMTKKTVIKYLRILEREGLLIIIKRRINAFRCYHEYYFPEPPIAYPWERNTPQPDPKPKKEEKTKKAKTVPLKEEKSLPLPEKPVTETCTCEQTITFPDGRIVCTKCLRTGFVHPEASKPAPVPEPEITPTGFPKRADTYLLSLVRYMRRTLSSAIKTGKWCSRK